MDWLGSLLRLFSFQSKHELEKKKDAREEWIQLTEFFKKELKVLQREIKSLRDQDEECKRELAKTKEDMETMTIQIIDAQIKAEQANQAYEDERQKLNDLTTSVALKTSMLTEVHMGVKDLLKALGEKVKDQLPPPPADGENI
jgi:septal ring factor EnvC (AmiA/AmiB activator)